MDSLCWITNRMRANHNGTTIPLAQNFRLLPSTFACTKLAVYLAARCRMLKYRPGCSCLHLLLLFADSRRQKAEVPAVGVKAGQCPPRSGRRALKLTAPRLGSRRPGNGRD